MGQADGQMVFEKRGAVMWICADWPPPRFSQLSGNYNLLINGLNGIYWSSSPFTNHLPTSCDILVYKQ